MIGWPDWLSLRDVVLLAVGFVAGFVATATRFFWQQERRRRWLISRSRVSRL